MSYSPRRQRESGSPAGNKDRRQRRYARDYYEKSRELELRSERERHRPDASGNSRWNDRDSKSYGRDRYQSESPDDRHSHRRSDYSENHRRNKRESDHEDDSNRLKRRRRDSYSTSPKPRRYKPSPSPSPPPRRIKETRPSPPPQRSKAPLPSQNDAFKGNPSPNPNPPTTTKSQSPPPPSKLQPNLLPSGKLAAETNTVAGTSIILKYNEPPESRKPPASQPWRLYIFKGAETLATIELSARSCWLFGRERAVVDFPIDHPSCSKQHAVLQFRYVEKKNEYGDREGGVRPYLIDLESANGTRVNGEGVPERRFVEVLSGDVLAFGDSSREYVLMLPPAG